jgi:hypothetical protein
MLREGNIVLKYKSLLFKGPLKPGFSLAACGNRFAETECGRLINQQTAVFPADMAAKMKIAILLHEQDNYPKRRGHFIWSLCDVWREWGMEIEILKGTQKYREADLLIPHVDTTVLPETCAVFFQRYQRVANRRVEDISKRGISRNLLTRDDAHAGPVIIKTNWNSGGIPDAHFPGRKIIFGTEAKKRFWDGWLNNRRSRTTHDWGKINCMKTDDYRVFPALKDVPEAIFNNESLVVERFLPEFENGVYYLRIYTFLGDRAYCARLGSPHPIVKNKNIVSREEVAIPDEVVKFRRELGFDYGKLDFVIHEGRVVVLDVNRTPGLIKSVEQMKANALRLAAGINSLF